jgi:hypothetical protein
MTSSRQAAANRANAAKSTGPKTGEGKRKSSQNARKHGLAGPPVVSEVARHLRIILNDDDREFAPDTADLADTAALRLAAAEAQVARAKAYDILVEQKAAEAPPKFETETLEKITVELATAATYGGLTREDLGVLKAVIRFINVVRANRERETRRMRRTAVRYINEAEAARHKALIAWSALLETPILETKPNSP